MSNDENNIRLLNPREHIRLRPGMYIGGTDERALHHLIYETVDNAVDEYFAGSCDHIWITLKNDNEVVISDNGEGLPTDLIASTSQSWAEYMLTIVGAFMKPEYQDELRRKPYSSFYNPRSIGLAAVNALSEELTLEVRQNGHLWQQIYHAGVAQTPLICVRELMPDESTGTAITLKPDFTIFEPNEFNLDTLARRSRELAYLLKNLRITLRDERTHPTSETTYHYSGGLIDYLKELNRERIVLHPAIVGSTAVIVTPEFKNPYEFGFDFAFQYTDSYTLDERSYINTVRTIEGGTHANALLDSIVSIINAEAYKDYPVALKSDEPPLSNNEVLPGLTAIISVQHPNPSFVSPTTIKLHTPDIYNTIVDHVSKTFAIFLSQNPPAAKRILQKCIANRRTRENPPIL